MTPEYFNTDDFGLFESLQSKENLNQEEIGKLNKILAKFKYLCEIVRDTYSNVYSYSFDNKWFNPVKNGRKSKGYYWYKIFPGIEAHNKRVAFTITYNTAIDLRIDSVGWKGGGEERKALLEFREKNKKSEKRLSVEEVCKLKSFNELAEIILAVFINDFQPLFSKALAIGQMDYSQQNDTINYWAGGYHWGDNNSQFDRFIKEGVWETGWGKDDVKAEGYYNLIRQIRVNDFFALKSLGGNHILKISAIGVVTNTNEAEKGRLYIQWLKTDEIYHEGAPKGTGAGNWFNTILQVKREEDIKKLFPVQKPKIEANISPENKELGIRSSTMRGKLLAEIIYDNLKSIEANKSSTVFGLFGAWGRGKTFIWNIIKDKISSQQPSPFKVIEFSAWKYQATPSIWAYLYEELSKEYLGKKMHVKWKRRLYLNYVRNGWNNLPRWIPNAFFIVILILVGAVIWVSHCNTDIADLIRGIGLGLVLSSLGAIFSVLNRFKPEALRVLRLLDNKVSFQNVMGVQSEVHKEIVHLIHSWSKEKSYQSLFRWFVKPPFLEKGQRLLLFIDDIDRCSIEKVLEIIDAIRVMLDDGSIYEKMVVVAAIDHRMLQKAIEKKIIHTNTKAGLVKEYMDKIFIGGIKLPPMGEEERKDLSSKIIDNYLGAEDKSEAESIVANSPKYNEGTDAKVDDDIDLEEEETISILSHKYLPEVHHKAIREKLIEYEGITPRQMKIVFYRFLLAYKIIYKLFPDLIEHCNANPRFLALIVLCKSLPEITLNLKDSDKELLKNDKEELYQEVLDMVVAY